MTRYSPKVASGLRGILGLFGASSPAMVMGINEENEVLTAEEKETLEETEAALAWIRVQLDKTAKKSTGAPRRRLSPLQKFRSAKTRSARYAKTTRSKQ